MFPLAALALLGVIVPRHATANLNALSVDTRVSMPAPITTEDEHPAARKKGLALFAWRRKSHGVPELDKLSPEEREKVLNSLSPEQRERVRQQLSHYDNLSPQQKSRLAKLYRRFRQLPAEQQEQIRKAYAYFEKSPPERQDAIRKELAQLSSLSPEQQRQRLDAKEFKAAFSRDERRTINGLLAVPDLD